VARGLLYVLLVLSNTLALALSLRGMTQMGSVLGTVTNTGTNFAASALLGWTVFGETLTLVWWAGAGMIVAGTVLVATGASSTDAERRGGEEGEGETAAAAAAAATSSAGGTRRRKKA
jgi:drug/metabolite transporter (DMT)-like permease